MQAPSPTKLWSRDFILLFGSALLVWSSFYFLLPILPLYVVQYLRGSPSQVGLLSGLLSITAILARPLAGYALDRWGRRWIQISFLLFFCGTVFAYNLAQSLLILFVIRLLHGIPFGVATTASNTVASDLVPATRRGEGMSYFGLAQVLAMVIGPTVALNILGNGQYTRLFVAAGVVALSAVLLALWVRYPNIHDPAASFSMRSVFERRVGWLSLATVFMALGYGGIISFITLYGAQLRIANAGMFFAWYAAGMVLARPFAGVVFDRRGPGLVVGVGLGLQFVAYLVLAQWQTATGFLTAAFGLGLGFGAIVPSLQAMAVNLVPTARRGAANATLFSALDIGIGLGSYLLGAVAEAMHDYATMYLVGGGVLVIVAALFFGVVMPRYVRRET